MRLETLHRFDTTYSADSIECCPNEGYHSYFACGTYQLADNSNDSTICSTTAATAAERRGRIYLFKFDNVTKDLQQLQQIETAAILDMKWLPTDNTNALPILATADALGQLQIFALQQAQLMLSNTLQLQKNNQNAEKLLALSLDWQIGFAQQHAKLVVSDSKGHLHLLNYSIEQQCLQRLHSWSAHNFEAWTCAFDKWNAHRLYSGGDDTLLLVNDIRTQMAELRQKSHMAGVTTLLSHPSNEHMLLTGSYDDRMRIFDTRRMKQPLEELNLNGGIWRLRCHIKRNDLILAACMYHNFSIVQLHQQQEQQYTTLLAEYNEHESICYGADWLLNENHKDELYMATCSFYDHKMCVTRLSDL